MTPLDQLAGVLEPAVKPRAAPPLATVRDAGAGLTARTVHYLTQCKGEPAWLRDTRMAALQAWEGAGPNVPWAPAELADIPFADLHPYSAPAAAAAEGSTRAVLQALDVSREEAAFLGGAQVQIDGEIVHGSLLASWARAGVVFVDSTRGLAEHERIFRPHFSQVVGGNEHAFTRLNAAFFSGGSFIWVPPGVRVAAPLKCYMHLQARHGTQFGRTLIVLGAGSELTFIEGCTSAARPEAALHCAVGSSSWSAVPA